MLLIGVLLLACTAIFLEMCHQALRRIDAPAERAGAERAASDAARLVRVMTPAPARPVPNPDTLRRPPIG